MSCYVKMIYVNTVTGDEMDEMDIMGPKYCPGAKAGNPLIDEVNKGLRKYEIEKDETFRKVLIFHLINTLELIIEDKENK